MKKIPSAHITIYGFAKKRCRGTKVITYSEVKESINRLFYRPSMQLYHDTICEMEEYSLIKEISGNSHKLKRYLILDNKEATDYLSKKNIFPIDAFS